MYWTSIIILLVFSIGRNKINFDVDDFWLIPYSDWRSPGAKAARHDYLQIILLQVTQSCSKIFGLLRGY